MRDRKTEGISDQELIFTERDRHQVFEQINQMEKNNTEKHSSISISKRFTYFTASLLTISICLLLFIPSILEGNFNDKNNETILSGINDQKDNGITSDEGLDGVKDFNALFSVKDEANRVPLNLLISYNKEKNAMKVLSVPRDTYAPISKDEHGNITYDKLTFAYGSGGVKNVRTTVSKLLDIPIDFYAVVDLETFSTVIDSVNGITYELQEDIQVRALSQATMELPKGTNRLNGEEVVALMIDATYGERSMKEEDLVNLVSTVMKKLKTELSSTQLKELTSEVESNISTEHLSEIELPSIQSVSLTDEMSPVMIDGTFYFQFEKEFLNTVSEELTTFK